MSICKKKRREIMSKKINSKRLVLVSPLCLQSINRGITEKKMEKKTCENNQNPRKLLISSQIPRIL